MPRIVYGVLDIHPSHRIEIPNPARAITSRRPDACTLCHVEKDRTWAMTERARLWPDAGGMGMGTSRAGAAASPNDHLSPQEAIFAGDPVVRAVMAEAIGRAPLPSDAAAADRASRTRAAALLDAMEDDRYPAVRHLAARALGTLVTARAPSARVDATAFDAMAPPRERARATAELRQALALPKASGSDAHRIAALRADAARVDIDIGE
jgi:hypothetical protein